ncbi:MAG: ABC transporter ATP-binding protein, partial [Microthrixaceae bacterium]|nr:ABC transporter ATP-binding protein [Microthrixaceae bacterium]
ESPSAEGIAGTNLGHAVGAGRKLRGRGLDLVVEDLSFSYDESSEPVLDSVSFDVQPGEVVALVGPTGSGKTTLMNLLVRLDEPDDGAITLGGVGIDNVDPDELRDAVSIAFQEGFLFASSIRENVAMGRDLGDADVTDSLERAEANRFVSKLPDGVDTVVGERGVTLSGGQRQRVALARALARKPKVLLLDDATSAVDPVIEAQILARLRDGATTMLIVAHRLSTILLADRVVFLDEGRVRAQGTHVELLGNPDYAALVQAYEEPGEGESTEGGEFGEADA